MIEKTLARRYAAALLQVAEGEGTLEETEELLKAFRLAYERDRDLRAVLSQPRVPRAVKKGILRRAFEGRARPSFLGFLDVLVERNRTDLIPEIAESFARLADVSRDIVRARVLSWRPLAEDQKLRLAGQLARITGKPRVELQEETDVSLHGGLLVRIGDAVIDGSLAHRLKSLREHVMESHRESAR